MTAHATPAAGIPPDRRRWIGLAVIVAAQFMVVLDVAIVNVALPDDQDRPPLQPGEPPVGRDGLLDPLRRRAPARRPHGRPARAPAAVHGRPRALHGQLAAGRARLVGGLADRLPVAAGPRGGAALAGGALDPDDHLRGRTRAEPRAGRLGRRLRQRRRGRRAARRRPDELAQLVVDLLHQRPGRPGRARARSAPAGREPRGGRSPPLRRPRGGGDHRRPDAARLRDDPRRTARLGLGGDDRAARRVRRADRRVRRHRAALARAAPADAAVPAADAVRLEPRPGCCWAERCSRSSSC